MCHASDAVSLLRGLAAIVATGNLDIAMKNSRGMTLVELMVVVGIMAIMAAFAAPSFIDSIRNNRLTSQTNNVLTGLKMARAEAVRRNRRVVFCRSDDVAAATAAGIAPTCSTSSGAWGGWMIFADANSDNIFTLPHSPPLAGDDEMIRAESINPNQLSVQANSAISSNKIDFSGDGMPRNTSLALLSTGVLRVCALSSNANNARDISLNAGGKTVLTQVTNSSCAAP
jgi:type IV fimbrial biogenesis protein FimT